LANSNQWDFNNLVKKPCHKTHCQCPHRLNLSFQSSRSCALPNIKVLKDKDLEFANSIRPFLTQLTAACNAAAQDLSPSYHDQVACRSTSGQHRGESMAELPSGTVTFLFTDIEGSTTRWEHQPEAMGTALARHDVLLRAAIREHILAGGEPSAGGAAQGRPDPAPEGRPA
jgi:hypothetical protein